MFLKELKDSLRQFAFVMAFIAIMPIVYLFSTTILNSNLTLAEYLAGGFAILWLIAGGYLSCSIFRKEYSDNAMEYLLSLPVPQWKLLAWKVSPRVLILFVFHAAGRLVFQTDQWFYNTYGCITFSTVLLASGFIIGINGRKRWSLVLVLFLLTVLSLMVNSVPPDMIWMSSRSALLRYIDAPLLLIHLEWIRNSQISYIGAQLGIMMLLLLPVLRYRGLNNSIRRETAVLRRAAVSAAVLAIPAVELLS